MHVHHNHSYTHVIMKDTEQKYEVRLSNELVLTGPTEIALQINK